MTNLEIGFPKPGPSGLSPGLGIPRPDRPAHHQTKGLLIVILKCSCHQKVNQVEALEAIAGVMGYGFETSNKYKIKNSLGQVGYINISLTPLTRALEIKATSMNSHFSQHS